MKIFLERGISHLDLHGVKHQDVGNEILDYIKESGSKNKGASEGQTTPGITTKPVS